MYVCIYAFRGSARRNPLPVVANCCRRLSISVKERSGLPSQIIRLVFKSGQLAMQGVHGRQLQCTCLATQWESSPFLGHCFNLLDIQTGPKRIENSLPLSPPPRLKSAFFHVCAEYHIQKCLYLLFASE
ncbi:hypothetical protein FKM82_013787 [Ascaphus truei]